MSKAIPEEKNITPFSLPVTFLLAALFAITPFAIDTYLPAVTIIASDLAVDASLVSITVSLYVLAMAVGQLLGGPAADIYGKKIVIIIGLSIFMLSSILLATTNEIEFLWLWRITQALGAGIAGVCVPAIIRDSSSGAQAAKLMSLIALIMMIAPAIAPSIGALILHFFSWHYIFVFLALMSTLLIISTFFTLPVTTAKPHNTEKLSLLQIVKHKKAKVYLFSQGLNYSVLMIYLSCAPLIYMDHFKMSPQEFSLLFFINVLAIVLLNRINSFLLNQYTPEKLLAVYHVMQLIGGTLLLLATIFWPNNLTLVVLGFALAVGFVTAITPNAMACFLDYFPGNSGSASAVLGFSQYAMGAMVSAITASFMVYNNSAFAIIIVLSTLTATTMIYCFHHKQ